MNVPEYDVRINSVDFSSDDLIDDWDDHTRSGRPPLIVRASLERWMDTRGLGEGRLQARPIGEGHSNVTCLIERGEWRAVLRRPPRPPLPPSAHDVLREARIIAALHGSVPVPRVIATSDSDDVIGAPFFVMELLDGHVIGDVLPPWLDSSAGRAGVGPAVISRLADLHAYDWRSGTLAELGRPDGYLERQLRRFAGLWQATGRDLPVMDRVAKALIADRPETTRATLVHGDYRLGNMMFARAFPARIVGVLDWELCTIGDPLADVGYLCAIWTERDDAERLMDLNGATRAEGFSTRAELVELYARATGAEGLDRLSWYEALALWKAAVLMENNRQRALSGASDDAFALAYADVVEQLAGRAAAALDVPSLRAG
jgi:aminoglycoside phosphotransferase (APT) family kinase protein